MTLIFSILIGTGALLLVSGIEGVSIADTFRGIVGGQPINNLLSNQSGQNTTNQTALQGVGHTPAGKEEVKPTSGTRCPPGFKYDTRLRLCVWQGAGFGPPEQ